MSGIAVSGGKAVTLVQDSEQQWVLVVDAKTGEEVWRTPVAVPYENQMGHGPRATPTIVGDRIAVHTGEGVVTVLDRTDGTIVWSRHVVLELGGESAEYGMASSPLVYAGLVIVQVGAPEATIAAYDLATGELRWQAGKGEAAGYSSPTVLTLNGKPQVIAFTGGSVFGVDPESGRVVWRHPWKTDYACNISVPLQVGNQVLISCGENHGSALLDIAADGTVTETWSSTGTDSVLRSEWQSLLLVDDTLYGFDNVGSAGPVTHFACINPATGERHWDKKRFGKGNAIAADGKLWVVTMDGELVLLRASPAGYEELSRASAIGSTRQAPALADGILYLRDDAEIVAFDVRKP
jgi:outer membrane protein assembly factor BamB